MLVALLPWNGNPPELWRMHAAWTAPPANPATPTTPQPPPPPPFPLAARRIADRTKIYIATDEERATDEFNARLATAIAVAVIIMPIVAVAGLASGR